MVEAFDQLYGHRSRHPKVSISVSSTTSSQGDGLTKTDCWQATPHALLPHR
jgi:hypothetical protein